MMAFPRALPWAEVDCAFSAKDAPRMFRAERFGVRGLVRALGLVETCLRGRGGCGCAVCAPAARTSPLLPQSGVKPPQSKARCAKCPAAGVQARQSGDCAHSAFRLMMAFPRALPWAEIDCAFSAKETLRLPQSAFRNPSSAIDLPPSAVRLPPSTIRLPQSTFRIRIPHSTPPPV